MTVDESPPRAPDCEPSPSGHGVAFGTSAGISPGEPAPPVLVQVRAVTKWFGPVQALNRVDLDVGSGQIHALLGANGSGKSTLVKVLAGVETPNSGDVRIAGAPMELGSIGASLGAGIRVVYQELAVFPSLTVTQNLRAIELAIRKRSGSDAGGGRERIQQYVGLFDEWGVDVPLQATVRDLGPPIQACVALAHGLVGRPRLLILDEPTASLGPREVTGLFGIIRRLASAGTAVLFVSHRMREVAELCDSATVLRNGVRVYHGSTRGREEAHLIELIASDYRRGSEPTTARETGRLRDGIVGARGPGGVTAVGSPRDAAASGRDIPLLEVRGLRVSTRVKDVTLHVNEGEVLGLAGLVGSGRTEVLGVLAGRYRPTAGEVLLHGQPYRPHSPADAMADGVVLVPEERRAEALFPGKDIMFNIVSSRLRTLGRGPSGIWADLRAYEASAQSVAEELELKARSLRDPISTLSGGNAQKVVLGRVMVEGLRLLLLDEPTRGVDVGARVEFKRIIRRLADAGAGVIYVSSELLDLRECDRIVVIVDGMTTGEAPSGTAFDEEELTQLCFRRRRVAEGLEAQEMVP